MKLKLFLKTLERFFGLAFLTFTILVGVGVLMASTYMLQVISITTALVFVTRQARMYVEKKEKEKKERNEMKEMVDYAFSQSP